MRADAVKAQVMANTQMRLDPVAGAPAPQVAFSDVTLDLGGKTIIENLSLGVQPAEFLCIVGASGCGKTTALRLAAGLYQPTRGKVTFDGQPMREPRREIAIVFQDYGKALLPWRTAAGNVSLALEAGGMSAAERPARIEELLRTVGLPGHAGKYPAEMSGGMQQRLQIARCLAQEPKTLLMDEPFGALDPMTRQGVQDEVLSLVAASGPPVIFVTHALDEAIYLGDRVIGLLPHPGRIGIELPVNLPRPRDQLSTRGHPEFLRLRRQVFDFIKATEQSPPIPPRRWPSRSPCWWRSRSGHA